MRQTLRCCTSRDGVRLAFGVHGSGPPLVRVATWLTHLQYDWDSPLWALRGLLLRADGEIKPPIVVMPQGLSATLRMVGR